MARDLLIEMAEDCVLTRTRVISRALSSIYDEEYRPLGVTSAQVTMLLLIYRLDRPSRAEIGRFNHQDRSTLTRNLKLLIEQGWIAEAENPQGGRARPIVLTPNGEKLVRSAGKAFKRAQQRAHKLLGDQGVAMTMDITSAMMPFPARAKHG